MQQPQQKIEYSGFSPSFSSYSNDNITSTAIAKVIREEEASRFHQIVSVESDDFEFSLVISDDEEVSAKEIVFPVFNRDLLVNRENKATDDEIDASSAITNSLRKVFIGEREETSSYSSLEGVESKNPTSGSYCVWRPTANGGSSPVITAWKKNGSTGSGSKGWILFRYLLRRINGGGKEAVVMLTPKKVDSPKQKRNSGVYEQFYVRRRAESEFGKRKSYLPYRTVLVGM